jgi:hypothetical protein
MFILWTSFQWRSFKENPGRAKLKKNTNNHVVGSSPFLFKTKPNFLGLSSSLVPEFNLCSKVGIDRELRCKWFFLKLLRCALGWGEELQQLRPAGLPGDLGLGTTRGWLAGLSLSKLRQSDCYLYAWATTHQLLESG